MAATVEKKRPNQPPAELSVGTDTKSRLLAFLNAGRKPGQVLKVTQVSKKHFRVNWMAPTTVAGEALVMRTWRMEKSQFLLVEDLNGELVITDQTA